MNTIIKYALEKTTLKAIFIDKVPKGLACNCICAKCGYDMIAVKGQKNEKHFRHHVESDCSGGPETAIHKMAKQIIAENTNIYIPGRLLIYNNPIIEKKLEAIVPDVKVNTDQGDVYFEIVVNNPVDQEKINLYKNLHYRSVRIDLSGVPYDISKEELEEMVLGNKENKSNIYWPVINQSVSSLWDDYKNPFLMILTGVIFYLIFRKK